MKKILLINSNCSWNKGSAAQVISTAKQLGKIFSDANFVLASQFANLDLKPCHEHNIELFSVFDDNFHSRFFSLVKVRLNIFTSLFRCMLWNFFKKVGLTANGLIGTDLLKIYKTSDLIIDLSGDTLSDKNCFSIFSMLNIFLGIFLEKRIIIFSQSIGPFKKLMIPIVRFCLNRVELIVVREDISNNYLKSINITKPPLHIGADIAFLLDKASSKSINEALKSEKIIENTKKRYRIGIGPSALIYDALKNKEVDYLTMMAKLADFLIEEYNVEIVLVSHVIIPSKYVCIDDRFVAKEIYRLSRNKKDIKIIKNDYPPETLKGIISRCELFIGARMHSNIAAISNNIPTLAIAWSHKYLGIMKMLELEQYVCDIETLKLENLIRKINIVWKNRDQIRKKLAIKSKELEKSAIFTCYLVKELLEANQ